MPRCFSISIQSDVAWRAALRALTEPAMLMAPENSSSFSVRVVLPASGWEMMANVRRRFTWVEISDIAFYYPAPPEAAECPGSDRSAMSHSRDAVELASPGHWHRPPGGEDAKRRRSEEHTSELQSREKLVCRL